MKKTYAFLGILLAVIATNYLVAEERERGDRGRNQVDFEKVAQELKQAVAEGKISEEDARRRMAALRERVGRDQNRKPTAARGEREHDGDREALMKWGREQRMKIEELKKAGKHEEAEKLAHETRRVMTEKMRHLQGNRERDERNAPRERDHTERGERDHDADPLERWVQQRARKIRELAEAGKHEEARELERETKRIVEERMHHRHEQERERQQGHDELERWANEREREIHELAEAGKHEEAKALQEETRRIIDERLAHRRNEEREQHERERHDHEHGERDHEGNEEGERFERWAHEQERHIHELHENNQHEEAKQAERELEEKMEHFHRQREREHGERERHEDNRHIEQRVRHLMVAIENLRAAGMHDLAEEVERRAHGEHREGDDHERRHHEEDRGDRDGEVHQLRREVDELRHLMNEMREVIGHLKEERNR